jgi:hypothetical protein
MGLFSKVIALDPGETPAAPNHPGLLTRAQSAQHGDVDRSEVKKKVRKVLKKYRSRRSRLSR